ESLIALSLYHLLHHTKHTPLYVSPVTWGNRPLLLDSDGNSGVIFFGPYSYRDSTFPGSLELWTGQILSPSLFLSSTELLYRGFWHIVKGYPNKFIAINTKIAYNKFNYGVFWHGIPMKEDNYEKQDQQKRRRPGSGSRINFKLTDSQSPGSRFFRRKRPGRTDRTRKYSSRYRCPGTRNAGKL